MGDVRLITFNFYRQMHTLAEPRDNKEIFPPKGNLHISSYQRFGPEPGCTGVSETSAMLSQIELKELYKPIIPQRTLLKMKTFASAEYVLIIILSYINFKMAYGN